MATTDFHLTGGYAPVHDELTAYDLPVTGALPPELTGWYLRNGQANTHVVSHAGRTLALVESSLPYEITTDLETVGVYDFDGELADSMTAHPKICPETGELHFFGCGSLTAQHVNYYRADAAGKLTTRRPIDVPGLTMMHDFALTAGHAVFYDLPVVFDPAAGNGLPYAWNPGYGARLGVLRRDDPAAGVRWLEIEPCYVFHTLNAFDTADGRIVIDVVRYPHLWWEEHPQARGTLWRWTLDPAAGRVTERQLDDRPAEFPRIDDRQTGADARFGHVTQAKPGILRRHDLHAETTAEHHFGPGRTPGEAVFVPADDVAGGDGWLLTYVHDAATDRSDLVVLDAGNLAASPVATVRLPHRVPAGFHGNWLPDA